VSWSNYQLKWFLENGLLIRNNYLNNEIKKKKEPAFQFIIDEFQSSKLHGQLTVKPVFGSHSIYIAEKIFLILRHKDQKLAFADNGLWIALSGVSPDSLEKDFPSLRKVRLFKNRGQKVFSDWLVLPESDSNFEALALKIVELILRKDVRIGKIPKTKTVSPKRKPIKKSSANT